MGQHVSGLPTKELKKFVSEVEVYIELKIGAWSFKSNLETLPPFLCLGIKLL